MASLRRTSAASENQPPVAVVSAASFESAPVAPEAIAAVFGAALATRTEIADTVPLPTSLAGTTVQFKDSAGVERLAPLFFVAPSQINCLVPAGTASGEAVVTVTSGDGAVSAGKVQIARVAPGLFTANASGQGVPAAVALRVKADGSQVPEPVARFDQALNRFVPIPIDLGPDLGNASEQVFLILFGTGIRGGGETSSVVAKAGGVDAEVLYAGQTPGLIGLDQANIRLPRGLTGRGRVNLTVAANGFSASNLVEVEIAPPKGASPPAVNSFSPAPALASQMLTIDGVGFSANPADLLVRMAGIEGRIAMATATRLSVQVPFGARSGPVSVRTPLGEGLSATPLAVRTSISGVVETTSRQPLSGVRVRLLETTLAAQTNAEGAFLLPDAPAGNGIVEIDGTSVPAALPFPKLRLKLRVSKDQDNPVERPVSLQQTTGATITVGGNLLDDATATVPVTSEALEPADTIQTGNITFEVPAGATVRFPDGTTSGTLTLTLVGNSRTPVNLPSGIFSPVIAQISPFGATINPGGKLTFPNPDGFPAGSKVTLFRLDQTANSPTLSSFVEAGAATVTADGQKIETAADAVKETSYYFVANTRPTTTVAGRVVDADGKTPVRLAVVRVRGQETFTDGNGGFILRNVPVNAANDQLAVEASFVRPSGRVDRVERSGIAVVVNGITVVTPDLVLPAESSNRPPVLIAPPNQLVSAGQTLDINFTAYDPDPGQTIQVAVSGEAFASVVKGNNESYSLRLALRSGLTGSFMLTLKATDNQGASVSQDVSVRVSPAAISCGQTRSGSIASTVQRDTFLFSGKANDAVILTAKTTAGTFLCMVVEVYSPAGVLVKKGDCNLENRFTLPSDGTYTLLIYDSGLDWTGTYDVNLQFADGRCAKAAINCGQTKSASIGSITQHDVYTFDGKANDAIILTPKTTAGTFLCVVAEVYGPTGTLVRTIPCNTSSRFALPSDGTYKILLYDDGLDWGGTYDLNLQFADGRCANASTGCGQTKSGSITSITQHDVYTFSGKANDAVILTAKTTAGTFLCVVAEVYGPTGALVRAIPCNTSSRLTLPSDGTYKILLYDDGLDWGGTYDLNLQFADGRCGTAISYGQTKNGSIGSITQHDVYTFSGKTNDAIILTAKKTAGTFLCTVAEVSGPTGMLVKKNDCDVEGRFNLPSDGMYKILIYDDGLDWGGTYSINLTCIGPTCNSALTPARPLSGPRPNSTGKGGTARSNTAIAPNSRGKNR